MKRDGGLAVEFGIARVRDDATRVDGAVDDGGRPMDEPYDRAESDMFDEDPWRFTARSRSTRLAPGEIHEQNR